MPQQPDLQGTAQKEMAPLIELYRDVLGGTRSMRAQGQKYLPKWEMEEPESYTRRLNQAVFYNATKLTQEALVGLVFRTRPELSDEMPAAMMDDAENIDLQGRHFSVFARDLFWDAWDGLAVIFVDMQRGDEASTLAEERAAGLRPYWLGIKAADVLRARPVIVNGQKVLGSFAFQEMVRMEEGEFGERTEHRVRDYRLNLDGGRPMVEYRVYAYRKPAPDVAEQWVVIEDGILRVGGSGPDRGTPMDEIPASVDYTGRKDFYDARPPLLDLAYENIDHYQQRSEHRKGWQYARVPIPVFPGMEPDDIVIAADRGITTPTHEAKPYYLETEGNSLAGSKEELLESERRMANLGAQMLYRPDRSNETATARRIENAQSTSRIADAAQRLEDCLENAWRLHAKWRRLEAELPDSGLVTINQDFEDYEMDAQMIAALNNAVVSGTLRLESFLTGLRDGVPVMAHLDPEAEAELLGTEAANDLLRIRDEMQQPTDQPQDAAA